MEMFLRDTLKDGWHTFYFWQGASEQHPCTSSPLKPTRVPFAVFKGWGFFPPLFFSGRINLPQHPALLAHKTPNCSPVLLICPT